MTEQQIQAKRELMVVKSNALIQKSRYSLTPLQFDLLTYVISHISRYDAPGQKYNFSIKDFCQVVGLDDKHGAYVRVKRALDAIDKVSIWIPIDGKEVRVRWFNTLYMVPGSGEVVLSFHEEIEPHLMGQKEKFTKYIAAQSYALKKCKYSKYLFDFCMEYKYQGRVIVSVDEFNKYICPNNYTEYRDINQWILKPAIAEINSITDITVSVEAKKTGRKTTHLIFRIEQYKPMRGILDIREYNRKEALGDYREDDSGEDDEMPF